MRIEIARSLVVKRLLAEHETQKSGSMERNGTKAENVNKVLRS